MSLFFLLVFISLVSYRAQRLLTSDSWPPTSWFREQVKERYGEDSAWYDLFTCPWCVGAWVSILFVAWFDYLVGLPLPVLWPFAVSAVVGYLGTYDS